MPFKYIIYYYMKCDDSTCSQETPQRLDDTRVTGEAESSGWVTPDGINWYCPAHANSTVHDIPQ